MTANYATSVTVLPPVPDRTPRRRRKVSREVAEDAMFDGQMIIRNGRPYDPAWDLWRPPRRWPGALLSAIAIVGLVVAVVFHFSGKAHPKKPHAIFVGAGISPTAAPVTPPSDVVKFRGKAGVATITFTSKGTLLVWNVACKCRDNYGVIVRNSLGDVVGVPVNATGKSASASPTLYPAGTYTASVVATGPWHIDLIDPTHAAFLPTTYRYVSKGSSVLGPFHGPVASITFTYIGSVGTVFSAKVVTMNSIPLLPTVYHHSFYYGTQSLSGLADMYFIYVSGPNLWSVATH